MELRVKSGDITRAKAECLVVGVLAEGQLPTAASELDASLGQLLSRSLAHGGEKLKAGGTQMLTLPEDAPFQRALLVGAGKAEDLKGVRQAASAVAKALDRAGVKAAAWLWHDETERALVLAAEHLVRGFYQYTTTKTKNLPKNHLKKITFYVPSERQTALKAALERGEALGNAANFTRELGNLPGNICTPSYLAETAEALAADDAGLTVEVLEEKQLKKLGMGALLAVARGSDEPARLIVMNYRGAGDAAPVVLVGKGITFDTGGISIKPGPGMDEMKFDMCGAASVLGVMHLLKTLKPAVNVIGVVAAAENMPSGRATKPGDVVTTMAGLTVEILNTDAEGRLVLCDALTYVERFNPAAVIDIATLTGACVIALGNAASGLFSTDDDLATALLAAGETAQDRAWRMPVWDEYDDSLKSNFADYANIGGREAGSVTAACFLKQFTKAYKWAHLDIAGTAWTGGAAKGASGRPVALLAEYLLNIYGAAEPNREGV